MSTEKNTKIFIRDKYTNKYGYYKNNKFIGKIDCQRDKLYYNNVYRADGMLLLSEFNDPFIDLNDVQYYGHFITINDLCAEESHQNLIDFDFVFLAQNSHNSQSNSKKIIKCTTSSNEVEILKILIANECDFIPKIFDIVESFLGDIKLYYVVMEYIGEEHAVPCGSLVKVEKNILEHISCSFNNLKKLHSYGIIHNDLHAHNVIYCREKFYFIDFGISYNSKSTNTNYFQDVIPELRTIKHFEVFDYSRLYSTFICKKGNDNPEFIKKISDKVFTDNKIDSLKDRTAIQVYFPLFMKRNDTIWPNSNVYSTYCKYLLDLDIIDSYTDRYIKVSNLTFWVYLSDYIKERDRLNSLRALRALSEIKEISDYLCTEDFFLKVSEV